MPRPVLWLTTAATPREEWLVARRGGLGGSDVTAIVGASPYTSPFAVWLDKTGRGSTDKPRESARWGTVLEDAVAREWAARRGVKVRRVGMVGDRDRRHLRASLDRVVVSPGSRTATALLEVKTISARVGDQLRDDEALRVRFGVQTQWYLALTGLPVAHLAVLVGGQELREVDVAADPAQQEQLVEAAHAWWGYHVIADRPPPLTDLDFATTSRTPAADPPVTVTAGPQAEYLMDELRDVDADRRDLERREKALKAQVQAVMGGATELRDPDGQRLATWATATRTGIDTARLTQEHPDLAAQYATTATYRTFKIDRKKDA